MNYIKIITILGLLAFLQACTSEEYTVVFIGHDGVLLEEQTITKNTIDLIDPPIVEGYVFEDWYVDEDFSIPYDSSPINQDTTLYAKYTPIRITITLDVIGFPIDDIIIELTYGQDYSPNILSKDGYDFSGWFETEDLENPIESITVTKDITLYSTFIQQKETIALILDQTEIDLSYLNQSLWLGINSYAKTYDYKAKMYYPNSSNHDDFLASSITAINEGATTLVFSSYLHETCVYELQYLYPELTLIIVEGNPNNVLDWITSTTTDDLSPRFVNEENTYSIYFNEEELGFLAGYALVADGYQYPAFVGSYPVPRVISYGVGFIAGVYYASETLGLDVFFNDSTYIYSETLIEDSVLEAKAAFMYSIGVDVIISVTGDGFQSILSAADEADQKVIHTDFPVTSKTDSILTSTVKDYDFMIHQTLYDIEFSHTPFTTIYYSVSDFQALDFTTDSFTTFTIEDYNTLSTLLKNKEIDVPSTYQELVEFLGENHTSFRESIIQP